LLRRPPEEAYASGWPPSAQEATKRTANAPIEKRGLPVLGRFA
jgi:hypothetical protein